MLSAAPPLRRSSLHRVSSTSSNAPGGNADVLKRQPSLRSMRHSPVRHQRGGVNGGGVNTLVTLDERDEDRSSYESSFRRPSFGSTGFGPSADEMDPSSQSNMSLGERNSLVAINKKFIPNKVNVFATLDEEEEEDDDEVGAQAMQFVERTYAKGGNRQHHSRDQNRNSGFPDDSMPPRRPPPPPQPQNNHSYHFEQNMNGYPKPSYPHSYQQYGMRALQGQQNQHPSRFEASNTLYSFPPPQYFSQPQYYPNHNPYPDYDPYKYAPNNVGGSRPEQEYPRVDVKTDDKSKRSEAKHPGILALKQNIRKRPVVLITEDFSEYAGRCRSIRMILSNLGVAEPDLLIYCLDSRSDGAMLHRYVTKTTGYDNVPVLFIDGQCIGDYAAILSLQKLDHLRPKLLDAGIRSVVNAIPTATLSENIFGYPKALVDGQFGVREGSTETVMNVLIACCGSSAADKIPTLVEKCVANNWSVKLLCTKSGEHFFKSFGSDRVVSAIGAENIYRDEDEWSFEYEDFDMPVRACHLALRKWADVLVVAPITCNSMAKCVAGIGDNLLSSVLVAWEYHKKTAIFCPACNADMWKNLPTQRNVAFIRKMGVEILGPRVDRLTNGEVAIGCMEYLDKIVERLQTEENKLLTGTEWIFRRAQRAAADDDMELWNLVLRSVDEGITDVNAEFEHNGTTLLHLASGGESYIDIGGKVHWGNPDLEPMQRLLAMGANVNAENAFAFTPIRIALAAHSVEAVRLLVEAKADTTATLIDFRNLPQEVVDILSKNENSSKLATKYYFTYGSLKRGFPNYQKQAKHLQKFLANAKTVDKFPLVVPHEPSCTNPHCPFLHQQATLCNLPGVGLHVKGELFEVEPDDILAFDQLEGFVGSDLFDNVYNRSVINVEAEGLGVVQAYVYFSSDTQDTMYKVESGEAAFIEEYEMSMAKGDLKPGAAELMEENNRKEKHDHNHDHGHVHHHDHNVAEGDPKTAAEQKEEDDAFLEVTYGRKQRATRDRASVLLRGIIREESTRRFRVDKLVRENAGSVQQSINTCSLSSVMMALKTLGIHCSIDNMFASLKLPSRWVVEQGLTLAQVFSVITTISGSSNPAQVLAPGITAECYHFDAVNADYDGFVAFLEETLDDSDDDVVIANFSTKIARDFPGGGGHFSLIAGYDPETDIVTIADVHPLKYGVEWTCSARRMFDSMVDQDSAIARSRGLIRLATNRAKHINGLDQCRMVVSFRDSMFNDNEQEWLSRWGDLPVESFESHINMGGLNSLGLCLSGFLSEDDYSDLCLPNFVGADYLAWSLGLSITELLGNLYTPRGLTNHARRAFDLLEVNMSASCIMANLKSNDALHEWLQAHIGPEHDSVALVLLDINDACGVTVLNTNQNAESFKLHHGSQHWCVLTMVKDINTVIVADPRGKLMGRLWKCPVSRLREGLIRAEKEPGRVVVVTRHAPRAS